MSAHWVAQIRGALRSKVVWFNLVMAGLIDQIPYITQQLIEGLPDLQPYLGSSIYKHAMGFVIFINFLLRFRTRKPLAEKGVTP
jgi:hypothetical protein